MGGGGSLSFGRRIELRRPHCNLELQYVRDSFELDRVSMPRSRFLIAILIFLVCCLS